MSIDIPTFSKWYAIVVGAFLVYFVTRALKVRAFKKRHGCEPMTKLPGTGNFNILFLLYVLRKKSEGKLVDFVRDQFVGANLYTAYVRLAGIKVICTGEPDNLKAMLATQFGDFALGTRHAHFKPLLGDGIFTLDGEGWKQSRTMLRPQFAREQVAHVRTLEPHLQIFAQHIRLAKGSTIELQELFFKLTVDTASEFLFGDSVHSLYDAKIGSPEHSFEGKNGFGEAFNLTQKYLASRAWSQMFYFLVDSPSFRRSCNSVHRFAQHYVNKALSLTPQELEEKSKNSYTFLYELAKHTRNSKVLQDQLLNILVAGRDTTAGLLSFAFFELARNQDKWEKLKEEVYKSFGTGSPQEVESITFETLKRCEYLKWVLNEILRMYPSVAFNFRVATKDTTLPRGGGKDRTSPIFVGKGTTIAYSVYSTHRDEGVYGKDSMEFKPERWAVDHKYGWAYLPFNGGPRVCLGQQFALTEASYIVARLIQMFPNLVSKDDSPYPPNKAMHLTMCHQEGVFVELS